MPERVSVEEVVTRVSKGVQPPLIAIDGLPCSGKGTLVAKLKERVDLDCIELDDFVLPEEHWPSRDQAAFPFQFIRYDTFVDAVKTLAATGRCSYYPFDWSTLSISEHQRELRLTKPIVIEGVSALNPVLCDLYGLRIFVESDRSTALQAALRRGGGAWERQWRELFLPSSDIYMRSHPERRADLMVPGRALSNPAEASLPDPQVDLILQVVLSWATAQPKIRAVALVGSRARGTAHPDSDIDLMLLATDPNSFRADNTWVAEINWHAIGIRPHLWQDEEYGAAWSRRIWLPDCRWPVELTFASLSWANANSPDAGTRQVISHGCRILHDPDALLARLCKAIGREIEHADRRDPC